MMPFLSAYPEMISAFLEAYVIVCWTREAGSRGSRVGERVVRGNRRAGSEISHDELVESFGVRVVWKAQTAFDCITYAQIMPNNSSAKIFLSSSRYQ